jgi:hypothetical protein
MTNDDQLLHGQNYTAKYSTSVRRSRRDLAMIATRPDSQLSR